MFFNLVKESFRFAIGSLTENKLRTFLSLLGITIGIFAIISVFTMVDSIKRNIDKSINKLGDNVIYVQKWHWSFSWPCPSGSSSASGWNERLLLWLFFGSVTHDPRRSAIFGKRRDFPCSRKPDWTRPTAPQRAASCSPLAHNRPDRTLYLGPGQCRTCSVCAPSVTVSPSANQREGLKGRAGGKP